MIAEELIEACSQTICGAFARLSEDAQWFVLEVAREYGMIREFQYRAPKVDADVFSYAIFHAVEMGL